MNKPIERLSWPVLIAGAIVTMASALSVHAYMLEGLHIPYPENFPKAGWARLPDGILSVLGYIYLSAHFPEKIRRCNFGYRCAFLFVLIATINEAFFRYPFMNFINLSGLTLYPFLDNIPRLIPFAVIAVGVESWTRRKTSLMADLSFAGLLAAFAGVLVSHLANEAFAGVIHFTGAREGVQRYGVPYDWHILLPAYLTFFEPVISALAIGCVVRQHLPTRLLTRFVITAALILAMRGPVFAPFVNIHYANSGPVTAMLSYAQFTFETMTLALLTAATLHFSVKAKGSTQSS